MDCVAVSRVGYREKLNTMWRTESTCRYISANPSPIATTEKELAYCVVSPNERGITIESGVLYLPDIVV